MNSASNAAPLPTLRRAWFWLALISVATLLIGYATLRIGWNPQSASRWITLAALISIYHLWILWSGLDTNHRPGEATVLSSLGAGTLATAARGLLLSMTVGFLFSPRPTGGLAWAPMVLFTSAIALDYTDGYLARKSNQVTVLGQRYDLELDSLGMLIGSSLAIWYQVLPWFFVVFGLASYIFRFGLWMRERKGRHNRALPDSKSRRPIAGLTMGYLSAMLWPIANPLAGTLAGLLFLVPFGASFSRDWLVVSGALDPDGARYLAARQSAKSLLLGWLPPLLRAVLGIVLAAELLSGHVPLLIFGLGVLILAGIAGRISALVLLLPLALIILQDGLNAAVAVLLVCAVSILILGTGKFSLWKPEEQVFSRRAGAPRA